MKKPGPQAAHLTPDAHGWRLALGAAQPQRVTTLSEAAAAIPAGSPVHLALPTSAALLERVRLPATDRDELAGMLQLQLEKTLPYPVEEVSSHFEVLRQEENESTLLSIATHHAQLDALCEPLRAAAHLPGKITIFAQHVAASCPAQQVTLCVWPEEGQTVVAIVENQKLGFAQSLSATAPEDVIAELPAFLLGAEMESVPTEFSSIRVEAGCAPLAGPLGVFFGRPIEMMSFDAPLPEPAENFVPAPWQAEVRRAESAGRVKSQLQLAAVVWLLLIAAALGYLAMLKKKAAKLDAEIAVIEPQLALTNAQKARWEALDAAINPNHYPLEILRALQTARPSKEVMITLFNHDLRGFQIDAKAPNAAAWDQYVQKLRTDEVLKDFKLDPRQPTFKANDDTAYFQIFGKRQ